MARIFYRQGAPIERARAALDEGNWYQKFQRFLSSMTPFTLGAAICLILALGYSMGRYSAPRCPGIAESVLHALLPW